MSLYGTYVDLSSLSTIREEDHVEFPEEEEENFLITSLLTAAAEGNVDGVEELIGDDAQVDIHVSNRHGETALHMAAGNGHLDVVELLHNKGMDMTVQDKHGEDALFWAARQGHVEVVGYLKEQCRLSLDAQNQSGDAALHVAARINHTTVIKYLCDAGANVSIQNKHGDTALHITAWQCLPIEVSEMLCAVGAKVNLRNKDDETALHCAAARNSVDCLKVLLANGADINVTDKRGCTALHFAVRRKHVTTALLLLRAGCQLDCVDLNGETALHGASRDGLLPVVQLMCAYGCRVDIVNKNGMSPLHLSSKAGHIEVVRCLLLSGANIDLPNKDGISSEIMALANGQHEVAELLDKLKPDRHDAYVRQLIPTSTPLSRIKLKVFGDSGVGKTRLIDSLKCGYFGSLLRKAGLGTSPSTPTPPLKGINENGIDRRAALETRLCYEPSHVGYTRGIEVQQVSVSGVGDVSVWEFSGYQPYYVAYDHFIGDINCVHVVVVSLSDSRDIQLKQLIHWLSFLRARLHQPQSIGRLGRSSRPAHVVIVATHSDCVCAGSDSVESTLSFLLDSVRHKFELDIDVGTKAFAVNATIAMSPDMKLVRSFLSELKTSIVQSLGAGSGFLDATVSALPGWRRALPSYPVVSWSSFVEYIRATVNSLASDEHIRELVCQLQLVGEVVYVETEEDDVDDLIVLSPQWLGSDVIGRLLSHETTSHCRPTGCFTIDDFQPLLPDVTPDDVLILLAALELSTRCDLGDDTPEHEVEHELPCLNFVETLAGLWDRDDERVGSGTVYGGVRFEVGRMNLDHFINIFPRVQSRLRHLFLTLLRSDPDCDLYQWFHGSKFCTGTGAEALITLERDEQVVELKCRGQVVGETTAAELFRFREELTRVIVTAIKDCLPGITIDLSYLSAVDLAHHDPSPYAYPSRDVLVALSEDRLSVSRGSGAQGVEEESLAALLAFGCDAILTSLTPGTLTHVSQLPSDTRRRLCIAMDPPDPTGRDWCMLAVTLGLSAELPAVEAAGDTEASPMDRVLTLWSNDQNATVARLVDALVTLGRTDVVGIVLSNIPVYDDVTLVADIVAMDVC